MKTEVDIHTYTRYWVQSGWFWVLVAKFLIGSIDRSPGARL